MPGSVQNQWFRKDGTPTKRGATKTGSQYRARFVDRRSREHSKSFGRKVDADQWLAEQKTKDHRGEFTAPAKGKLVFSAAAGVWLDRPDVRESTRERDRSYLTAMILPRLGGLQLSRIEPDDIDGLVADLIREGKAPSTVRKAAQIVGSVFKDAQRRGLVGRSPADGVRLPKLVQDEMMFISADDIHRVCDALGVWRPFGLVGGFGGLRFGEVAGLKPGDLDGRVLHVKRTATELSRGVNVGPPKTSAAVRAVTLPRFVAAELEGRKGRYMFTDSEGGVVRRRNWTRRVWKPAVETVGLAELRFHDLRHSHVSLLIADGENPKTIAARLGHSSVRTVLDVYGHLMEGADKGVADRLEKYAP